MCIFNSLFNYQKKFYLINSLCFCSRFLGNNYVRVAAKPSSLKYFADMNPSFVNKFNAISPAMKIDSSVDNVCSTQKPIQFTSSKKFEQKFSEFEKLSNENHNSIEMTLDGHAQLRSKNEEKKSNNEIDGNMKKDEIHSNNHIVEQRTISVLLTLTAMHNDDVEEFVQFGKETLSKYSRSDNRKSTNAQVSWDFESSMAKRKIRMSKEGNNHHLNDNSETRYVHNITIIFAIPINTTIIILSS